MLLQKRNRLINWGFNTMEGYVLAAAEAFQPAVKLFNGPIGVVDRVICRSIDFVETKVPSIYLPPEMVHIHSTAPTTVGEYVVLYPYFC